MENKSPAYQYLKGEWTSTCRTVLGGEIGELDDFSGYLSGLNDPLNIRNGVVMTSQNYCPGSLVRDMQRANFMEKFAAAKKMV